ncbi:MAG: methionyl-tRNA formyltransferase [Nitrospiraceae bacterium]|nr:methionyl-tRNA formyltransferase [Nitrospiraceae bacterium]
MAIIFFGTPEFAIPSLRALHDAGEDIAAAVTRRDAPKGRSRTPSPPPVKELALGYGLKVLQPKSMKDPGFADELEKMKPEFLAVVAYGRILTSEILSIPKIAPVNVHASLLPRYRGASPIAWAIINGERETGVTTMVMAPGLDAGDILLQEKTAILPGDTKEGLSRRLSEMGAELLVKTLRGMREGRLKPVPQGGGATFAPPLKKEDGLINWNRSAREIFNFVRGTYPWPGAFCFLGGERIKFLKVEPVVNEGKNPGAIEKADGELLVGTASGLLRILKIQPEGKRPMSARDFLQGRKIKKGDVFSGAVQVS